MEHLGAWRWLRVCAFKIGEHFRREQLPIIVGFHQLASGIESHPGDKREGAQQQSIREFALFFFVVRRQFDYRWTGPTVVQIAAHGSSAEKNTAAKDSSRVSVRAAN